MKKVLLPAAMFVLLLCCNCRAQSQTSSNTDSYTEIENPLLTVFRTGSTYYDITSPLFYDAENNEFLIEYWNYDTSEGCSANLLKLRFEGDMLVPVDTIPLHVSPKQEYYDQNSTLDRFSDGTVGFMIQTYGNDTLRLRKATLGDDGNFRYFDYDWESTSFRNYRWETESTWDWVEDKDENLFFGYVVDSLCYQGQNFYYVGVEFLKFSRDGRLGNSCLMKDIPVIGNPLFQMIQSSDSLGFRVVIASQKQYDVVWDCHTFDADLNHVSVKENIDNMSYPYKCFSINGNIKTNPFNGNAYTICSLSFPQFNQNPEIISDVLMGVFGGDDFDQLGYVWGLHTPTNDDGGVIAFDGEGGVYMVAGMDIPVNHFMPQHLYIIYMDENLNKYNEIYYDKETLDVLRNDPVVTPDKDLMFACYNSRMKDYVIVRVPHEAFLGIDEAHDAGFAVAVAYPNPGGNTLNIRTALTGSHVELYDTGGRLVGRQEITGAVTSINTEKLPSGIYVWKVIKDGSEAESGKWVKE